MFVSTQLNPFVMINLAQSKRVVMNIATAMVDDEDVEVFGICAEMMDGERISLGVYDTQDEATDICGEIMSCAERVYVMPQSNILKKLSEYYFSGNKEESKC